MEHVVLLQMEEDMTDEQEKDMLDHLYSLQYHYRGILAVSLGAPVCLLLHLNIKLIFINKLLIIGTLKVLFVSFRSGC